MSYVHPCETSDSWLCFKICLQLLIIIVLIKYFEYSGPVTSTHYFFFSVVLLK